MYLFQRKFRQAELHWLRLEDTGKNTPRTHLQLGKLYFCMDSENPLFNLEKARRRSTYAKNLNREEIGAPLQLSKIAIMSDDMTEAVGSLDAVLSADDANCQALFLRGYIDRIKNKKEAGMKKLMKAWRIYQGLGQMQLHGEGTTKKGARAMLSEDLYCDRFQAAIDMQMMKRINEVGYQAFHTQMNLMEY